ncbi:S-adenosyl-L-methionine-dependent methyltransferase [Durotheca rogersii]|uniref:S-adenosyl-L-methionine-dependent methyltransferase n=1 Tax=Durotheca rogersii TaxID=419775 RepID=UPI002220621F|nr:S-adenosyl-L-methionine-dependent methyltransferase [Durotheca rogersii]KAI5860109.1 S-adenosyl-L-methionine-dependent methyltransferase [Durotheca rogersii]
MAPTLSVLRRTVAVLARTVAVFTGLLDPWVFMSVSLSYLPRVLATLILAPTGGGGPSLARIREAWFGAFWREAAGPGIRARNAERVRALLRGRVHAGRALADGAEGGNAPLAGVVLELGAGAGFWVDVFPEVADCGGGGGEAEPGRPRVERIYGVEPNAAHHPALRAAVARAGLADVYDIVPVGIEALRAPSAAAAALDARAGRLRLPPASVDCIVSLLCLCSIPDPERNIRALYDLLRDGGRWYVYEHVRCEYSWYMRAYQRFVNIFWPHFLGGCQLCRPTATYLRAAGGVTGVDAWSRFDLAQPPEEEWWHTVPHVLGVLTK